MGTVNRKTVLLGSLSVVLSAIILLGASACTGSEQSQSQSPTPIDWETVGQAVGKEGELMAGDVYRINLPRGDLNVTSGGVTIQPGFALGSYTAFKQTGDDEALVMGDLVLTEEEYNRVISRLQEGGIEQTAVHKHLLEESPAIWWTHIHGQGEPVEMAETIRAALDLTGTPLSGGGGSGSQDLGIDTGRLDEILGHTGRTDGGIYKYNIGRAESVTLHGTELNPPLGVATVLNFQPTGNGNAAINGDFVMTEKEVNPVIRALRENGIEVVSLHNHTLDEEPRLFYMHFWANDDAETLARGLRVALNETNSA